MPSPKRDIARLERRLVATLTEACETAKAEIPGFDWLTHTVDYAAFPQSLRVTWVFDTRANQDHALATGADQRMRELTAAALHEAEVTAVNIDRCVRFDSEQACSAQHGGDWRRRLG
ncbi:hypothetical protein ACI77J_21255 [Pseudomonas sp. O64]|uniref:hypothetical protein n=1 Tax=Pseudomonas TaxID=286 RepID=UPI000BA0B7D4|nr:MULTISPECIES: hypothetical protein [unclassified Pseudomonas]MCV2226256.1 hypothetical protein [Pseudomonas sp. AU10]OZO02705.1 hypothetical protein B7453_20075 [Pseudomonas sp. IB20]UNM18133.1 hypothetical protein K0P33_21645 [Pseudomonas sp. ArH3a]UXZ20914.1 hypothetical protein KZH41_20705 [Pseudomonas sp. YeP6b]